jgi:hypothetical protein
VAWPAKVHKGLGVLGVGFLWDLLAFNPANRLKACAAREHPYLKHGAFKLFVSSSALLPHNDADWPPEFQGAPGCHILAKHRALQARLKNNLPDDAKAAQLELPRSPGLSGHRHECNILCGFNAPEVSAWLLADKGLMPGSTAFEALQLDFEAENSTKRRVEQGRKVVIPGAIGDCSTTSMHGLTLKHGMVLLRFRAWHLAFSNCNATSISEMDRRAKAAVRKVDAPGANGTKFLEISWRQWFVSATETCFIQAGNDEDGYWDEEEHQDGGASILHLGVTLCGRRDLVMQEADSTKQVLDNRPGSVYLGTLTGPRHQVFHKAAPRHELLSCPGLGDLSVTVMCRTSLFAQNHGRRRNATPGPAPVFYALAHSFNHSLRTLHFRLPSLAECEAAMSGLVEPCD